MVTSLQPLEPKFLGQQVWFAWPHDVHVPPVQARFCPQAPPPPFVPPAPGMQQGWFGPLQAAHVPPTQSALSSVQKSPLVPWPLALAGQQELLILPHGTKLPFSQ
jgi:hypothetical protein